MAVANVKKRSRDQVDGLVAETPAASSKPESTTENKIAETKTEPSKKKARIEAGRSLFVRSLPASATDETLTDFFSQHFPVKSAVVVKDPTTKQSRGYGFVVLTDTQDANDAKTKLHGYKLDGKPISIEVAKHRDRKSATSATHATEEEERRAAEREARKPPKLIVRNLPWSIKKPDQLAALFRGFGKIYYCDLPNDQGKLSGFGFVTMKRAGAERALQAVNGKVVDGRPLAVDWAVSKQEWGNMQKNEKKETREKKKQGSANQEDGLDDEADKEEKTNDKNKASEDEEEDEDLRNFMKNFGDKLEEEPDSQHEDEEDEVDTEGDDDDAQDEDDQDLEGGADEDEDEDKGEKQEIKPAKRLMTDNSSTLFIRNLPFSSTDENLKSHFEQFGAVRYARVVMDRATDRPAGTGFVNFVSLEDAKTCLKGAPRPRPADLTGKRSILQDELADAEGRYTLEGRVLQLSQAVSKDEATKLTADGVATRDGKDRDKRRLYLLAEGNITPGSPLFSLLSSAEVKMRDESGAQRKKQIQSNPSLHLSLTRLAIRNIPRNIDHKELKALAREAVVGFSKDCKEGKRQPLSKEELHRGGDEDKEAERKRKEKGKGIVKQAKVVYENKEGSKVAETDGASKSRGYGFVEFTSHRWAIMGLRWLNGYALKNTAGKDQRLIVEFAIENANVISRRNELQAKFSHGGPPKLADQEQRKFSKFSKDDENKPRAARFNKRSVKERFEKGKQLTNKFKADGGKAADKDGIESKKSDTRNALEQKIIGRKRVMKKKKAGRH